MLKSGVDLRGLNPVWGIAFPLILHAFTTHGYDVIVTSANDSTHGANSLHYKGKALDLRTKHIRAMDKAAVVKSVKDCLGAQFDVVFESEGLANEHLHIEWDVKETEKSEEM